MVPVLELAHKTIEALIGGVLGEGQELGEREGRVGLGFEVLLDLIAQFGLLVLDNDVVD